MSDYIISQICPSDILANKQINELLLAEGIRRDANLDYTCGMYDDEMNIIATGSCFGNTLRCIAVSSAHQGEGLMNQIVTHLISVQFERGNTHLFLYTKCNSAKFFGDLGFYEIARIDGQIVFMENRKTGFSAYLERLKKESDQSEVMKRFTSDNTQILSEASSETQKDLRVAALVMNANPFTLGHQYLVEKAAAESDILHLFIVSEDQSLVPFSVRKQLVLEGTAHLDNIIYHESGPYIISNATFPSYFQKDAGAVMESHANLDLTIFVRIAQTLGINCRYVGEEPNSQVTGIYNKIMARKLPENEISCTIVPREEANGAVISASTLRTALKNDNIELLFAGIRIGGKNAKIDNISQGGRVARINKIKAAEHVVHH